MKTIKFDIMGICEVRRTGCSIEEYSEFILCTIGTTPGQYGVGFIIKKTLKNSVESFVGISERVALLKLKHGNQHLDIIQVYAPTESADDDEILRFYDTINEALKLTGKHVIVMGDYNAKIGQPEPEEYLITKHYGYGSRNDRGEKLIQFAYENNLSILNTFFIKRNNRRWTWRSPDGRTKNELDYILSNQPSWFQNIEIINTTYPSDHRPVRGTIMLHIDKRSRANYNKLPKSLLKSEHEISAYRETLEHFKTNLLDYDANTTVQNYHDTIINAIERSLETAHQRSKEQHENSIITQYTKRLIRRRHELQNTKPKTVEMKKELSALYKLTSKCIKNDYSKHRQEVFRKHLASHGSLKKAYKELRTHKNWIEGIKNSGQITHNRNDILTVASNFYRALYKENQPVNVNYCPSEQATPYDVNEIETINETEVIQHIKRLKLEKRPGPDKITNEAIKHAATILAHPLTHLFNLILKTESTPKQWSESNIIILYKKGDPNDIGNYRPISLLPSLYKLFSSILEKRISKTIENNQPVEQAGFRSGFSTMDHVHTVELLIEKYQEFQKPLYIAFIDYQKAFDTLSHFSIWQSLKAQHVEPQYINILKYLYENSTSRVQLEKTGPPIRIERGVRQGDPISPKIFIAVLESIISKLNWTKLGIPINGKHLHHLRFADDIVLFSERFSELEYMIHTLQTGSRETGLEINFNKTKIMTNSIEIPLKIDDTEMEYVHNYIYLGKQISFDRNNNDHEIERRIKITWNKFWSHKEILKSTLPIKFKKQIMDSCLLPSLTYAAQTWKFTLKIRNKIKTCQRSMERSITNIKKTQKIRHSIIRNKTNVIDAVTYAMKLKWKWAGHVARMQDKRWTKNVTSWAGPSGKRKRGRPYMRWSDEIRKISGTNWTEKAQDRTNWLTLEEAFTREGVLAT
jgi:hypothetical protein